MYLKAAGKVTLNGKVLIEGTDYTRYQAPGAVIVPFAGPTTLIIDGAVSIFAPDPPSPDAGSAPPATPDAGSPPPAAGGTKRGCTCTVGTHPSADAAAWLLALAVATFFVTRRHPSTRP